jgi:hypothetical protein
VHMLARRLPAVCPVHSLTTDFTFPASQASEGKGLARAVYISPMQALATERVRDWSAKFGAKMGLNVVELAGEPTSDHKLLEKVSLPLQVRLALQSRVTAVRCACVGSTSDTPIRV